MEPCLIPMPLPVHVDTLVEFLLIQAYTYFNDTFTLLKNGVPIAIDSTGISWPGDKGQKYKRAPNSGAVQWIDP